MQGISRQILAVTLLVLIAWPLNGPAKVVAQDAQEVQRGQERRLRADQRATAPIDLDKPIDSISITIWALTVGDAAEPPADELVSNFADRVNNLPDEFSSPDEVRELVGQLKVAGMLRKACELRLTTLDGQSAVVSIGSNRPRVIATSIADRTPRRNPNRQDADPNSAVPNQIAPGQNDEIVTNSITMEPVGTIVRIVPRVDSSGVLQVKVDYNSSAFEKSHDVVLSEVPGRKPLAATQVVTQQVETVVRLKSGTAVLVQADSSHTITGDAPLSETRLLILAASVDPARE